MRNDKWRISGIRNLNYKPGRRLLFVAVCLIMALCFCVPGFAAGEVLEYEDIFDDSNSVAVVRCSRWVDYIIDENNPETVYYDDYYQSTITEGQVALFSHSEFTSIKSKCIDGGYNRIRIHCQIELVYRHLNDSSAVFPIDCDSFYCRSFKCFVNLSPVSIPDSYSYGNYKIQFPGNSTVYSGTGSDVDGVYVISVSNSAPQKENLYYSNSLQLKSFEGTFVYDSAKFDTFQTPVLEFSFSNIYNYTVAPETTQIPETTVPFVPGVDTAIPSDTMQGKPDDIDNVLEDRYQDFVNNYTDILNGFSWVKFASCFGFLGKFFGAIFQFEPFADILNAWAIFAVFNILLGGFITGVSAYVHVKTRENERKERQAEAERERIAKRNIERQRSSRWWSDD